MLIHVQHSLQGPVGNMQALVSQVICLHVYRTMHVAMLVLHLLLVCMHGPVHMHMHYALLKCILSLKSCKLCPLPYASALVSCYCLLQAISKSIRC